MIAGASSMRSGETTGALSLGDGRGRGEARSELRERRRGEPSRREPHPEERGEASRLEGCSRGRRRFGACWSAPRRQALRGPFGAPQDEGIENDKGNSGAAFPTAPHSHSGPSVYAIGLAGQGAAQGVGIIPQAVLLFAGCVSAPDFGHCAACRLANSRRRLRRNARMGNGPMSSTQVAGSGTGAAVKTSSATRLET